MGGVIWDWVFILTFWVTILVIPGGLFLFMSGKWPFRPPEQPPKDQDQT